MDGQRSGFGLGFSLGDWQVDASGNRLLRGPDSRPLRHKAMALLVLLAREAGQTVTREQIVQEIWAGNGYVAQKGINNAIWAIRQALGDDPEAPRYLETITKQGYRLIAPVRWDPEPAEAAATPAAASPASPTGTAAGQPWAWLGGLLLVGAVAWAGHAAWRSLQVAAPTLQALPVVTPLTQLPGHEYLGRLSPDGQQLALAWWQGRGDGGLYLRAAADLQGTPRALATDQGDVQSLAWSPDGRQLAFTANTAQGCTLWLQDLGSGARRALARCAALFTPVMDWSPDGRWLVFSSQADGAGGLFLLAPEGGTPRRLTTAPPLAMADHQPAWSPDSQRVAFARQDPADGTRDLYETTLDGRTQRLSTLRLDWLHGITYASDGRDLVFSTTRQDTRVLLRWDRRASLPVPLGLEGSAPHRAADGRLVHALLRAHVSIARLGEDGRLQRLVQSLGSDRSPTAAPGGAVVFVSRRSGHTELWSQAADGSSRALTQLAGVVATPELSPDGQRVAFLGPCGPGRRQGLCVLDMASGAVQPVATDAALYGRPAWRPGTQELWVASDRGGAWQLWRFDLAVRDAQPVATERPPGRALQWSPDGAGLIYQARRTDTLRWRPAAGGAERAISVVASAAELVDWRLGPRGLVLLQRGEHEDLVQVDPATGTAQRLSRHPLSSFPERASLALDASGAVLVEVANSGGADLMLAR